MNTGDVQSSQIESFSKYYAELPSNINIDDKTLEEWDTFFSVTLKPIDYANESNVFYLREKLVEVSNKIDTCSTLISKVRLSRDKLEFDASTARLIYTKSHQDDPKMSTSKLERLARTEAANFSGAASVSEMILAVFLEYMSKLKRKAETVTTLLQSIMSEMRRLSM